MIDIDSWEKLAAEALCRSAGRDRWCLASDVRPADARFVVTTTVGVVVALATGRDSDEVAATIVADRTDVPALATALREATAEIRRLCRVVNGEIAHTYDGLCPDAITGPDSRDPNCDACRALGQAPTTGAIVKVTEVVGEYIYMDYEGAYLVSDEKLSSGTHVVSADDLLPDAKRGARGRWRIVAEFTPEEEK